VLRAGVGLSILLLTTGIAVSVLHHPNYAHDPGSLAPLAGPDAVFTGRVAQVAVHFRQGHGRGIMMAGLLVLIATPVLRVAVSIVAFATQRDWRFALMTAIVLINLLVSFLVGQLHGS
jgi:uncharacterized membrane protein